MGSHTPGGWMPGSYPISRLVIINIILYVVVVIIVIVVVVAHARILPDKQVLDAPLSQT